MNKIKKPFLLGITKDILLVLLALVIAIILHECAHCLTAFYFGLEQKFALNHLAIGPIVEYSANEFVNRVVDIAGLIANTTLATISILVLFIIQVYLPGREETILSYSKKLHTLIEQRHQLLIGGHITFKLFLLIFALANILLTLFIVILYPFTGAL